MVSGVITPHIENISRLYHPRHWAGWGAGSLGGLMLNLFLVASLLANVAFFLLWRIETSYAKKLDDLIVSTFEEIIRRGK